MKSATELLRDDVAFLSIVTPDPVVRFLSAPAEADCLYDRLVIVCGTPGSGKTTLARLFEYPSLRTLTLLSRDEQFRDLAAAMVECRAMSEDGPRVIGCRLQMASDYRDFWECPYSDKLKMQLMTSLLQARSILSWFRHLKAMDVPLDTIELVPRQDAVASLEYIGGTSAVRVLERAREIETALYGIVGVLVPPPADLLCEEVIRAYEPFDVIERLRIHRSDETYRDMQPLVICDDAHELHGEQYTRLVHWLGVVNSK